MNSVTQTDRVRGAILGSAVGDALGVPVLYKKRCLLEDDPVTCMLGHGSRNKPAGTWSDHTSLQLCTIESLIESGFDLSAIMKRFAKWYHNGYMTATGKKLEGGNTATEAIDRYLQKLPRDEWGSKNDWQNGNGALMRILPVSLHYHLETPGVLIEKSFSCSALTHAHIRSQLCCGYFSLLVKAVMDNKTFKEAMEFASDEIRPFCPDNEVKHFKRILDGSILEAGDEEIESSHYAIHTLETALYCTAKCAGFSKAVLCAVNLGEDTYSTAALTGALSGLINGYESIPAEWLNALAKKEMIDGILDQFINTFFTED